MNTSLWYAMFCKPQRELQVTNYLSSKGFEVLYPTLRVKPANPRSETTRSFFPRYLFVRADLEACGLGIFQWAPGAVGLVEFGGEPAPIADITMAELKRRVSDLQISGCLNASGLRKGDAIRIVEGPFAGYDAIFDSHLNSDERTQVLLRWLGRAVKVEIQANAIEKYAIQLASKGSAAEKRRRIPA